MKKLTGLFTGLLVICIMAMTFTACGETESNSGKTESKSGAEVSSVIEESAAVESKEESKENGQEFKVVSLEEFSDMFTEITLNETNFTEYFEVVKESDGFYLTAKNGVLAHYATYEGEKGAYIEFNCIISYDVTFTDAATGIVVDVAPLATKVPGNSSIGSLDLIKLTDLTYQSKETQTYNGVVCNYTMTVTEITGLELTKCVQSSYSVCKYEPKTEYYTKFGKNNFIVYYSYSETSPNTKTYCGITDSGSITEYIGLEEVDGKYYLNKATSSGSNIYVVFDSKVTSSYTECYGDNAWFPLIFTKLK